MRFYCLHIFSSLRASEYGPSLHNVDFPLSSLHHPGSKYSSISLELPGDHGSLLRLVGWLLVK